MKNSFIAIFQKRSKFFYAFLLSLGLVNSIISVGVLIVISSIVSDNRPAILYEYGGLIFGGLIIASLLVNRMFQSYLIRLTNNVLFDFEIELLQKLRMATFESFEKLGSEKVFTAIGDTRVLGRLPNTFVAAFNALITASCCLFYLFSTSVLGGLTVVLLMGGLLTFYLVRNKAIKKDLNSLRDLQNQYFLNLNDLLLGFKEIKMSTKRNENIFTRFLLKNRVDSKDITVNTSISYMNNDLTGTFSWYIVLGVIMFLLPSLFLLTPDKIISMIMIILYLMAPVNVLITMIPVYTHSKIAVERLTQFDKDLDTYLNNDVILAKEYLRGVAAKDVENAGRQGKVPGEKFQQLELENVVYQFQDKTRRNQFTLGPIDLKIERGEVVFITGGNGSGKSTLANVITGLYKPNQGRIRFNGREILHDAYPAYMDNMAAIFTSHYLFNENYDDFDLRESNERLQEYIGLMKMGHAIHIMKEKRQISNRLSKGQQKRLALIYALMEERDIIILDEWAAEQDPQFRAYFYKELLPKLRQMEKTVIAITHDDDYYAYADRVIKFDYGKVVSDEEILTNKAHGYN
jgi:cyclic peptide transporter